MGVRESFELNGKVALVTGGSRGLGLQMATALGEMGARIALSARKPAELEDARMRLANQGINAFTVVNDLSQPDQVPALVDKVVEHYGRIDILVNNAGASWGAPAEHYPLDEQGHEPERDQCVRSESGGGEPLLHTATLREHHRRRVDRSIACGLADGGGCILRIEGGGAASDPCARRRVGTSRHPRHRDLSWFFPLQDDRRLARENRGRGDRKDSARPPGRRYRFDGRGGLSGVGRVAARHRSIHCRRRRRIQCMSRAVNDPSEAAA